MVLLVSDATATFDWKSQDGTQYSASTIHDIHLASLNDEFCKVQTTKEVMYENA